MTRFGAAKRISPVLLGVMLVSILLIGTVGAYILLRPVGGTQLVSTITITYTDGTKDIFESANTLWGKLVSQSVLGAGGKTIASLSISQNINFDVKDYLGAPTTANAQWWVNFYVVVTGPFISGNRNCNILGCGDNPIGLTQLGSITVKTNRMDLIGNNLLGPFSNSPINAYYMERGSGLSAGNLNWGVTEAHDLQAAASGNPITAALTSLLVNNLAVQPVKDAQSVSVINWATPHTGPQLWNDFYLTTWDGFAFCNNYLGCYLGGKLMRMQNGDGYVFTFHTTVAYRWQDATGQWTPWGIKDFTLATLNTQVANSYYTNVSILIGSGCQLNFATGSVKCG